MMLIGIKFCGGCNPRYDRKKVANSLTKTLNLIDKNCSIKDVEDHKEYDIVFVISGCLVNCASIKEFHVRNRLYYITSQESLEEVLEEFILENRSK